MLISGRRDRPAAQHIVFSGVVDTDAAHRDVLHFFNRMDEQDNSSRFHRPQRYYYTTYTPFVDRETGNVPAPHESQFIGSHRDSGFLRGRPFSFFDLPEHLPGRDIAHIDIKQTGPIEVHRLDWFLNTLQSGGKDVTSFHYSPGLNSRQDIGHPDGTFSEKTKKYPQWIDEIVKESSPNTRVYITDNDLHFGGPQGGTLPYHQLIGRVPNDHLWKIGPDDMSYMRVLDESIHRLRGLRGDTEEGQAVPYLNLENQPVTQDDIWRVRYNKFNDENTLWLRNSLLEAINHNLSLFAPSDPFYKQLDAVRQGLSECRAPACAHNHDSIVARAKSWGERYIFPVKVDDNFQVTRSKGKDRRQPEHGLAPVPMGDEHVHALNEMMFFLPHNGEWMRQNPGYENVYLNTPPN